MFPFAKILSWGLLVVLISPSSYKLITFSLKTSTDPGKTTICDGVPPGTVMAAIILAKLLIMQKCCEGKTYWKFLISYLVSLYFKISLS
jgi:hypothetical protein